MPINDDGHPCCNRCGKLISVGQKMIYDLCPKCDSWLDFTVSFDPAGPERYQLAQEDFEGHWAWVELVRAAGC